MNESSTASLIDILKMGATRPLGEVIILLLVTAFTLFLFVAGLVFLVSRLKGNVSLNFLSLFKIGKKKSVKEDEDREEDLPEAIKDSINITINNTQMEEDVRAENNLLTKISQDGYVAAAERFIERVTADDDFLNTNMNDLLVIISKSVRFGSEIAKYKEVALIKSQMSAAEMRIDIVEGMIIKEYMEALYKKRGSSTNIQDDSSYRIFSDIVHTQAHRNVLGVFRKIFKDNHLIQYSDQDYADYTKTQCDRIVISMKLAINSAMPSFLDPNREEVNKIISNSQRAIFETFEDIFTEARGLAFKTELIIKRKEKDFDEEIKRLTGITNAHKHAGFMSEDPYKYQEES